MNILCTICSDIINQAENIFVTKCGHVFHHHCLSQWIERSKSCPQCRNKVTERCMFRLYPTISNETSAEDAATLQSRLDDALLQLRQQKAASQMKDDKLNTLTADLKSNVDVLKSYEKKLVSRDSAVTALKEQLGYVKIQLKETNRLKEENETLQKNLQTLDGLQKVLNATSDEVEKILQSYTDLRTIALFATSLKRALCDSEGKKNEYRDKLHSMKQQLAAEKSQAVDLRTAKLQLEDRLATVSRKYEALKHKRKAPESLDCPAREETPAKQARHDSFDLNIAILEDSPSTSKSFGCMVNHIQNTDSPYLTLKQSSLALSALQRAPTFPDNGIKPSEFAIVNAARAHSHKSNENVPLSIFHKKQPIKHDSCETPLLDISYDGLGGHSKLDKFPTPKQRPTFKSCVPKVTAKHKLKRPSVPSGNQDIGKLLERMSQDR